jgi:signal transduction histidine kinase
MMSRQNAGAWDGLVLHCAVTDAGPGVPAEFCDHIFEKLFQVAHHRWVQSKERTETSSGLYWCKDIIPAHGGAP